MARRIYIGTGTARKVKAAYIGSGNVARKIVKGYVGVGNQAKQFWPIQYVWNRYEVDSITKYRDGLASYTSDLYDQITGGAWPYRPVLFNSYIFNTATGEYTGSGGYWTPDYESKSVSGYLIQPNYRRGHVTHIQFDQMWSSTGSTTYYLKYTGYQFNPTQYQENIQGSYIGQVKSENRSAYPDNGVSGSYWYVYQGEG